MADEIDPINRAKDKFINDVIENPLDVLTRIDTTSEILTKLAPTLPGEFPFPIPRGIYDKIKDSPAFRQNTGVK